MASNSSSSQLAGRYATALFALADEKKKLPAVAGDLEVLNAALAESEDLQRLINSPVNGCESQDRAMEAILKKTEADKITRNFVALVTKNARLFVLPEIITAFQEELSKRNGEVTAEVTSARALTKAQTEALEKQLKTVVGAKVKISTTVDESILGGLVVKVGSRMIDSSLKTKLSKLQMTLANTEVAA